MASPGPSINRRGSAWHSTDPLQNPDGRASAGHKDEGVRTFVLGASGSGKTTLCRLLRSRGSTTVMDMDDEIVRVNGGTWPESIEAKARLIEPVVLDLVCSLDDILLLYSHMPVKRMERLRREGFRTALLDVDRDELTRRLASRAVEEGWDNSQWLDWNLEEIRALAEAGMFDLVVSGDRAPSDVADDLLRMHRRET